MMVSALKRKTMAWGSSGLFQMALMPRYRLIARVIDSRDWEQCLKELMILLTVNCGRPIAIFRTSCFQTVHITYVNKNPHTYM